MPTTNSPRPSFTARDFESATTELQAYVQQTQPDLFTDFNESTLGQLIIDLIARGVDTVSFGQDQAALEFFLSTLRRYDSALRFADSVGYAPATARAATAVLTNDALPDAVQSVGGTIAAGVVATGPNGLSWYLPTQHTIASGNPSTSITVYQLKDYTETFEPANRPRTKVTTRYGIVADGEFEVFVGDTGVPTNQWTKVANVALETSASNTYEATFDGEGRLVITFGDGTAGAIPTDTVTVFYRVTEGVDGNLATNAIAVPVVISAGGATYTATFTNSGGPSTGGQRRESVESMRKTIPAFIRSQDRMVTISDYDTLPLTVAGIGLVYSDLRWSSYRSNVVDINIWTTEDVTFTGETVSPIIQSAVTYTRYAQASQTLIDDVHAFARTRTITSVFPVVSGPTNAWVDLYFGDVVYNSAFDPAEVHAAITQAVVDLFEGGNGFDLRLSRLNSAVRNVEGVNYFTLERMVWESLQPARATGTVAFTAQPADGNTVTINDGDNTVVFEFDNNSALTTSGAIAVTIANSSHDTMSNLVTAINTNLPGIRASKNTTASTPQAALEQQTGGAAYNLSILKNGSSITVTGMEGGSDTLTTVREDRRRVANIAGFVDPYPPGTYAAGAPFTGSSPWQTGGILPYRDMADVIGARDRLARNFYNDALVFNNEVTFREDAGQAQALNLRRLVFTLVPDTE